MRPGGLRGRPGARGSRKGAAAAGGGKEPGSDGMTLPAPQVAASPPWGLTLSHVVIARAGVGLPGLQRRSATNDSWARTTGKISGITISLGNPEDEATKPQCQLCCAKVVWHKPFPIVEYCREAARDGRIMP